MMGGPPQPEGAGVNHREKSRPQSQKKKCEEEKDKRLSLEPHWVSEQPGRGAGGELIFILGT